eukprot:834244_1
MAQEEQPKASSTNFFEPENDDEFDAKFQENKDKLMVLDFGAAWCNPCKLLDPMIKKAIPAFPNIIFMKLDVDECDGTADDYNVKDLPTIKFVNKGKVIGEVFGARYEKYNEFENEIRKYFDPTYIPPIDDEKK